MGDTSIKNSEGYLKQLHFTFSLAPTLFPCRKDFLHVLLIYTYLYIFRNHTANPEVRSTILKCAYFSRSCLCLQTLFSLLLGPLLPLTQICSGRGELLHQLHASPALYIPKEMFLWSRSNNSSACLVFPPSSLCFSVEKMKGPSSSPSLEENLSNSRRQI